MKVSTRNVFRGAVTAVHPGAVNAEVEMSLGGTDRLVAIVTMTSLRSLDIRVGSEVLALVKAPWVMLVAGGDDHSLSARNGLHGQVLSISDGEVNAEVLLRLSGGSELLAVVTRAAVSELGLQPGAPATAIIKASSVVLGVPA